MEVPDEFRDRYMERRRFDLEICRESIQSLDFHELERVGHQLKGNGTTFGYSELSLIGKDLELAAATKDTVRLKEVIHDFSLWLNQHLN